MGTQIILSSANYTGFIADITFFPQTGGTISLGSHLTPYTVNLDYYFGTYELCFSAFNSCCFVTIFESTPTPTPNPTPTPTPTFFSYRINPSNSTLRFCSRLDTTSEFVNSTIPLVVGAYYCSTFFDFGNSIFVAELVGTNLSFPNVTVTGGPYANCQGECQ
jgi:hypothetical protein